MSATDRRPGAPRIAAIICTFNRAEILPNCLSALAAQDISPDEAEILIVDNNSTDETPRIASEFAAGHPHVRLVREQRQGLAAARNRGLREVRAPIAAFTDDDAEPARDWLSALARRMEDAPADVIAVGGEIEPIWPAERPGWLSDALMHPLSARLGWSDEARILEPHEWLCEVNSAYRRAPLMAAGGFPENLGRVGQNLLSGENIVNEFLRGEGWRLFFDPAILVRHHIAATRMTKDWFRRRMFWQGVSSCFANRYLETRLPEFRAEASVALPVTEAAWLDVFGADEDAPLEDALGALQGLGFLLAAQGLLEGR